MKAQQTALRTTCALLGMTTGLFASALTLVLPGQFDPAAMVIGMVAMVGALYLLSLASADQRSRLPILLSLGYLLFVVAWMISTLPLPPGEGERAPLAALGGVWVLGAMLVVMVVRRMVRVGLTVATLGVVFALNGLIRVALFGAALPGWGPAGVIAMAIAMSAHAALIATFLLCLRWYRATAIPLEGAG